MLVLFSNVFLTLRPVSSYMADNEYLSSESTAEKFVDSARTPLCTVLYFQKGVGHLSSYSSECSSAMAALGFEKEAPPSGNSVDPQSRSRRLGRNINAF